LEEHLAGRKTYGIYLEVFPKQDSLSGKGLGNLVN
jgi:hypothetical protein